jgi:hypothetical protein
MHSWLLSLRPWLWKDQNQLNKVAEERSVLCYVYRQGCARMGFGALRVCNYGNKSLIIASIKTVLILHISFGILMSGWV